MTTKSFHPVAVNKKPARRVARSPSAKPAPLANARLIHGFIVRLAPGPTLPAGGVASASAAATRVKARAKSFPAARLEGPADDATFH